MRSIRQNSSVARSRARRALAVGAVLVTALAADFTVATASSADAGGRAPVGQLSNLVQDGNGFQLRGWAYDADSTASVKVGVRVDGHGVGAAQVNLPRPDVAKAHPSYGPNTGFALHADTTAGTHEVCAYAV